MHIADAFAAADTITPPGSLPEEAHFESHNVSDHVGLVKTKSASNLLAQPRAPSAITTAKRMSIDAGQLDRMVR